MNTHLPDNSATRDRAELENFAFNDYTARSDLLPKQIIKEIGNKTDEALANNYERNIGVNKESGTSTNLQALLCGLPSEVIGDIILERFHKGELGAQELLRDILGITTPEDISDLNSKTIGNRT